MCKDVSHGTRQKRGSACLERVCVGAFRVAGVGDRGSACAALDRGLGVSRGRRGTPDARGSLGRRWAVDSLGRCGESCILTLLRAHFAWQVWGMVAIGAARVLSRDRRGDSCARRAFHVAGVGNGVTGCVAGHRFAWQAQGIVHGR